MGKNDGISLVNGFWAWWIKLRAGLTLFRVSFAALRNPVTAVKALIWLSKQRSRIHGNKRDHKIVRSGKRYYWSIYTPGFPSQGFKDVIRREVQRAFRPSDIEIPLQSLILSISSRCHYSCEHCFEGNNLNGQERLSFEELQIAMSDALENRIPHVQISGGEPMLRFEDMLRLMGPGKGITEFWLSTSGYGLTVEKAAALKASGVTGAAISLDHWNPEKHNQFRKHPEAYRWVVEAVESCLAEGIVPNLTLCVTREMAHENSLMRYLELAKQLGVPFVRFLEARRVGNYAGKDVLLSQEQQNEVVQFYLKINASKQYRSFPIIQYPGYHQRNLGCFGAGNRYLHIDASGDYHACPFCRSAVGNIREMRLKEAIPLLQDRGCHLFKTNIHV
jgi:MoaA/NifB/PqqE/SkfB family radical SAM enzyme